MSTSKQFNRPIEFLSTQSIVGISGGAVYIAGGLNIQHLNVNSTVTISNLTITNNLFTSTGNSLVSSQWYNIAAGIAFTSGNVGIGTTSPGFTLDISGGSRITAGLTTGSLNIVTGASIPNLLSSVITTSSLLATNSISSASLYSTNITTTNLVANFTSLGNLTSSTGTFANKVGGSQTVGTIVVTTSASLIGNTNTIGNLFTTGGNVGINTSSPQFSLDVNGTGRFTNLTSTNNTIGTLNNTNLITTNASIPNLLSSVITTSSLLATNSISSASLYSTNITTTNLVANFTSLGNLTSSTGTFANKVGGSQTVGTIVVTTSASLIGNTNTIGNLFTTGGNVGINTSSPSFTLDVSGTARSNTAIIGTLLGNSNSQNPNDTLFLGTSGNTNFFIDRTNSTGSLIYGFNTPKSIVNPIIQIFNNSTDRTNLFTIISKGTTGTDQVSVNTYLNSNFNSNTLGNLYTTGGNVGINTVTPSFTLDVLGTARINNNSIQGIYLGSSTGTAAFSTILASSRGSLEIGIAAISTNFSNSSIPGDVILRTSNTNLILTSNSSSPTLYLSTSGNVGINTSSPAFTLDVSGSGRFVNPGTGTNGALLLTGGDSFGHTLYIASSVIQKRTVLNHNGTIGNLFSYDYGATPSTPLNLQLQGPGGNVGIGTSTPLFTLDVLGNIRSNANGNSVFGNSTGSAVIDLIGGASSRTSIYALNDGNSYLQYNNNMNINRFGTTATVLYIQGSSGNIGINTSVPTANLDINGVLNVFSTSKTLYGGIAAEVNSNIINFGLNDTRFGATNTSGTQGGFYRVDSRSNFNPIQIVINNTSASSILPFQIGLTGNNIINYISNQRTLQLFNTTGVSSSSSQGNISITGTGQARYHLYNSGNVTEWVFGQKSVTNNSFILSALSANTETDILTVTNGGSVGINNTNPAYALDVSGTLRSTNNTILNSGNTDVLIVAQALFSYGSGLWTGTSQAGLQIGWNNLGGSGGTDFLNNGQGGGGPCFNFWVINSGSQTPSRIAQINNSGTYSQISDYRVKNNVKNLDNTFTIDKLRPVEYIYSKTNEKQIGFIAHEIQEIFPQLVEGEKDCENYQTLNYSGLIPVLTLEIQRLKTTIINQQNLINDILQRLNILENSK